jgi:hypothetical protein
MNNIAYCLIAAVIHEAGHVAGALLTGSRIDRIGINWRGPYLVITVDPPCRWKAVANLLSGPAANLLCGLAGGTFGLISVAMGILNLIMPMSDGMQAIRVWRQK